MRRSLLILALALVGCAPTPREAPTHRMTAEQWEKSLKGHTKADVKRLLGEPAHADADGVWTYYNARWDPDTGRRATLYLEFKDGVVSRARP